MSASACATGRRERRRDPTFAPAGRRRACTLETGQTIVLTDAGVIATATPTPERPVTQGRPRLGASAHASAPGHCLTKSRRYSTTFKALRQAASTRPRPADTLRRRVTAALAEIAPETIGPSAWPLGHLTTATRPRCFSGRPGARGRRAAREALSLAEWSSGSTTAADSLMKSSALAVGAERVWRAKRRGGAVDSLDAVEGGRGGRGRGLERLALSKSRPPSCSASASTSSNGM